MTMSDRPRRRPRSYALGAVLIGTALVASIAALTGASAVVPASAAPASARPAAAATDCTPDETLGARTLNGLDGVVRAPEPSHATVEAYERDLARRVGGVGAASDRRSAQGDGPRRIKIRVYAHVIKPSSTSKTVSRAKVRRQIKVMNRAFAGKQWRDARSTRFRFVLKKTDYTVNRAWYTAGLGSRESRAMRKALHRGKKRDLNLYIAAPTERGDLQVLGYATFPQRPKSKLATDGVVIHRDSMPGGRFRGYNKGDTAVHETGHWLGLYHTFQGGCGKKNDRVHDTPRERIPSFECPRGRDTCPSPGEDPIHNFMDYSYDRCMHHFTPGQIERMRKLWRVYRR
ncbi:zinc metalloprotease [Mumia sp. zg.B17]|nr:zinc metalloprotease [Mumia sp. zg.B17]